MSICVDYLIVGYVLDDHDDLNGKHHVIILCNPATF